jgi:hypothetical protein
LLETLQILIFAVMEIQLFFFNPTCEMAIANGQVSYMPPRHLSKFEADLAALPFFFGREKDLILVSSVKGNSLDHLEQLGWKVPGLITRSDQLQSEVQGRIEFKPWGWSPAVYRVYRPFLSHVHPRWLHSPFKEWNSNLKELLSRGTGYRLLEIIRALAIKDGSASSLLALPEPPLMIRSLKELEGAMKVLCPPAVIKTPWSASGRGLFRIRDEGDDPYNAQWVRGMLNRQGVLYGESWLEKIQDVSFHFWVDEDRIEYLGHNFFQADPSGQFSGCVIGFPENSSPLWNDRNRQTQALGQASRLLKMGLEAMGLNDQYKGPVGIDALFFKDAKNGELMLNPCVEVNMRYSMGLANVMLRKRVSPNSSGIWKTEHFAKGTWREFCLEKTRRYPPVMQEGILRQGFLPLVSPDVEKQFGAWLLLGGD